MKVVWTRPAQQDLAKIDDYLFAIDPDFADRAGKSALTAARAIADNPRMGSLIGHHYWKWPVKGSPYVLLYRVRRGAIEVLRVRHEREDWRPRA